MVGGCAKARRIFSLTVCEYRVTKKLRLCGDRRTDLRRNNSLSKFPQQWNVTPVK